MIQIDKETKIQKTKEEKIKVAIERRNIIQIEEEKE